MCKSPFRTTPRPVIASPPARIRANRQQPFDTRSLRTQERTSAQKIRASPIRLALHLFFGTGVVATCVLFGYSLGIHQQGAGLFHGGPVHVIEPSMVNTAMKETSNSKNMVETHKRLLPMQVVEQSDRRSSNASEETREATKEMARGENATQSRSNEQKKPVEERPLQRWTKIPNDWQTYSFYDVRHYFDCRAWVRTENKNLPDLEYWLFLRKQYRETVDRTIEFNDPVPPTDGYTLGKMLRPPFYAKRSEGRGRGLFASRKILKGELVHDGTHSDVVFPDAMAWRRFVFSLPRKMACDVAEWAWTMALSEDGEMKVFLDMNISALMNTGHGDESNAVPETRTSRKFHATRDIAKDEEILTDYKIFETNWKKVGLYNGKKKTRTFIS